MPVWRWIKLKCWKVQNKKFNLIRIHHYYDGITVFTCMDEKLEHYAFCLLNEDEQTYIGCRVTPAKFKRFILGRVDLRTLFEVDLKSLYVGKFTGTDSFTASIHKGKVSEDMMPGAGLVLTENVSENDNSLLLISIGNKIKNEPHGKLTSDFTFEK